MPLDVDVDSVEAELVDEGNQRVDRLVLQLDRAEEPLVARRPEARIGQLHGHAAVVRFPDELLARSGP